MKGLKKFFILLIILLTIIGVSFISISIATNKTINEKIADRIAIFSKGYLMLTANTAEGENEKEIDEEGYVLEQDISYVETLDDISNPERGFYNTAFLKLKPGEDRATTNLPKSKIVHLRIDISDFSSLKNGNQDLPIDETALNGLNRTLAQIKKNGSTTILRFVYDNYFEGNNDYDPQLETILGHIRDLKPVFEQNQDVITCVEMGFFGKWGELHGTSMANPTNVSYAVTEILKVLPEKITVNVRHPGYYTKWAEVDRANIDQNITQKGEDAYKVGIYNDGYLGSNNDLGTFSDREKEITWLENQATHTLYGGEVVANANPSNKPAINTAEYMSQEAFRTHTTYLNREWNGTVIESWKNETYNGEDERYNGRTGYEYINNHLGYRWVLRESKHTDYIKREDNLKIKLKIENVGFANLINSKTSTLVLEKDQTLYEIPINIDPTTWMSRQTSDINIEVALPEEIALGEWNMYLRISQYGNLETDNNYQCIQLANEGIWNQEIGANYIGKASIVADIKDTEIILENENYEYDGEAKEPEVTVKDGDKTLTINTDYTVTYSNNMNVGTGELTITGTGNYIGTKTKTFEITKKNVSGLEITLTQESYEYDGQAKEPEVTVKNGDKTLTINTDYTVTYSNNTNIGTATLTITGVGNYTGTKTKTFEITKKNVSRLEITLTQESYEYDGQAKEPEVTLKDGENTLAIDTDYTVTYSNNINAGTGVVTITGIGNYAGTKTKEFTIIGKDISTATITLENESYEYDGQAKEPEVTVKDGDKTLTINTAYTVTYSNNTNIGTATLTITGIGNYTGTKSKTFEIVKKDISGLEITLTQESYEYDGQAKEPEVTVKNGDKTLTINTDYTVTYSNNTNIGTATLTITGVGNYTGTKTKTFEITKKDVSGLEITLAQESYEYDGQAKEPEVTIKNGDNTLTIDTDYTVTYSNNTNIGTATLTITGVGNYTGTKTKTFEITKKNVNRSEITLTQESYEYDGQAKEPSVTVRHGENTLAIDTDYTVTYSNNINAGTGIITITGKGNYTGTKTKEFTIIGKDISTATITLENESYEYDGQAKEPEVTVKNGDNTLTINTDYTVTYSNNINIGTGELTITGIGNYTGTKSKTFEIVKKDISGLEITLTQESYEYNGQAKEPEVTVKDGDKTLTINTAYTVTYSNNTNIGTATLTITGVGNYTGTKTKTFEITKKNVSGLEITLTQESYEYDGQAKEPEVTVKNGDKTLTINTDYTVTYSNNTNIGTATLTITGVGNYTGTKSKTFEITKKNVSGLEIILAQGTYEYDGTAKKPEVTVKDGDKTLTINTDYTVTYSNNINIGTAALTIIGTGNYAGTKTKEFTIIGKDISTATITLENESYEYDGQAKEPEVTVKDGDKTLTINADYTVTYSENINAGTGTVIVEGLGSYSGTASKNFNIEKVTPEYVVPSGLISAVGRKLESVTLPNGFSWETNVNTEMNEVGVKKFLCKFTPEDTNNFNTVTGIEVEVIVNEKLFVNIEKLLTKKAEFSNPDEKQFFIYIYGLKEGQTIEKINQNIKTNGNKEIYKNNDEKILDHTTNIATGMKIKISAEEENIEYRLVVKGDNDGDGEFSGKDLLRLARHLAELDTSLKDEYLYASDVYSDGKINGADLLKMARSLCNLETL